MDINPLIHRIQQGDRSAFAGIVSRYQGPLFGYLGRMGLGQAMAEELAQEAFLRAWTHRDDFDPARAQFSTWLFTIAHRLALNELGRAARRHEVADGLAAPEAPAPEHQPPEALETAQRQRQVQAALRMLPLSDRSALALAYFQELDMATVARIENCSVATLKVRLHRAKARLRELLEKHHG